MEATFKLLMSLASNLWHWRPRRSCRHPQFKRACRKSGTLAHVPAKHSSINSVLVILGLLTSTSTLLLCEVHPVLIRGFTFTATCWFSPKWNRAILYKLAWLLPVFKLCNILFWPSDNHLCYLRFCKCVHVLEGVCGVHEFNWEQSTVSFPAESDRQYIITRGCLSAIWLLFHGSSQQYRFLCSQDSACRQLNDSSRAVLSAKSNSAWPTVG